ncbi:hypothetical protein M0804_013302 [Polistes exclamans]|nr:hypothetical protein M0804_013302 [Polistes exclamans]
MEAGKSAKDRFKKYPLIIAQCEETAKQYDIDYKVFTDAARHITEGDKPLKRHTYSYTPLLAFFLIPNIYLHKDFGKILFSLVDIVVAMLIRRILTRQKLNNKVVTISVFLWLYNPLTVMISTKGNAYSLAVLPGFLKLDFLQTGQFFLARLIHGFSAMVIVIYILVMTSQYFFWFLSLLPLCLPNIKMSNGRSINLISIWILSQGLWLFLAYLLEFQGFNTFMFLWISGLLFCTTNVKILTDLIKCYKAS